MTVKLTLLNFRTFPRHSSSASLCPRSSDRLPLRSLCPRVSSSPPFVNLFSSIDPGPSPSKFRPPSLCALRLADLVILFDGFGLLVLFLFRWKMALGWQVAWEAVVRCWAEDSLNHKAHQRPKSNSLRTRGALGASEGALTLMIPL